MSLAKIHSIFHKAKHNHNYLKVLLFPALEQHCSQDLQNPSDVPSLTSYSYLGGWTLHPTCIGVEMSSCSSSSLLSSQSLATLRDFNLSESTADERAASNCGLQGCMNHSWQQHKCWYPQKGSCDCLSWKMTSKFWHQKWLALMMITCMNCLPGYLRPWINAVLLLILINTSSSGWRWIRICDPEVSLVKLSILSICI